jgi:hypothetical protein
MIPRIVDQTLRRLLGQAFGNAPPGRVLDGFVDGLLQTFENCRAGLPDDRLAEGGEAVQDFFLALYEKETGRLDEIIERDEAHLAPERRRELRHTVDGLIRTVVVPAYVRLATAFTRRERKDFYLVPSALQTLERVLWAVVGIGLGFFVVRAPFIPIWSKEWVFVFFVGGLVFPEARRVLALRRYQGDLNRLVARTDQEVWRREMAYMTSGDALTREPVPTIPEEALPSSGDALAERLATKATPGVDRRDRDRAREGEH